ncbi:MAG: YbaB/EbfC family nucleoid-associated protein [Bdellovibrionales bacterium]
MKGFGAGGMQNLMKQANQMQNKMKKVQEEFTSKTFTGSAGGGAVEVVVTGEYFISTMTVKPEVLESGDAEMMTEMIQLATNDAIKVAKDAYKVEMEAVTGGAGIPGMF